MSGMLLSDHLVVPSISGKTQIQPERISGLWEVVLHNRTVSVLSPVR